MKEDLFLNRSLTRTFLLYCSLILVVSTITQRLLYTDTIYLNNLSDQYNQQSIRSFIDQQKKLAWTGYVFIPFILYLKLTIVTLCLIAGGLFYNIKISFKQAFLTAIYGDLLFVIPMIGRVIYFKFIHVDYTLSDIQNYSFLSVLNLFGSKSVSKFWLAPLQFLNLFEVSYWFVMAYFIQKFIKIIDFDASLKVVLSFYVPMAVLWNILIVFITIAFQ